MKHLIYFLLFSTVVFSQNYNYGIDEPQKSTVPAMPTVNNQLEEIEYFKAYLLPITKKATLQAALDTYGSVRLEKGDYSGVNIVMKSNQRLYGHPSITKVSTITVAAGSSKVYLEDLIPASLLLQSGGVISGCTFKSIRYSNITGTNVMFENNLLVNVLQTRIIIDCSGSGYFRNNKIIRHQVQSNQINLLLKGNSATPSYGNVHLHTNFLTPSGEATNLDNLQSATFVGLDSEGWNLNGLSTKAMLYIRNSNKIKITDFGGGNVYSAVITPAYDIDATEVSFLNKILSVDSDVISARTNMFLTSGSDGYIRGIGTQNGTNFLAHLDNKKVNYNGVDKTTLITGQEATNLTNSILGTQNTPWSQPSFEILPDPLGANWKAERVGKLDSRAFIQNLIDTKGIAELPEGIFYIGSSLIIPLDDLHGIQGQGTGKTVICGLADDFPLVRVSSTKNGSWHINNLTLQGGSTGIYVERIVEGDAGQVRFMNTKYVIFRDTNYGIHTYQIQGVDNCFFNNIAFVNCKKGYYQEPAYPYAGNNYTTSYIDKAVFYKSQFINCETAFSMIATRADNLNAWIDCKFDGGQRALDLSGHNFPIIANSIFSNYSGINIIKSNTMSIYNSIFNNNSSAAIISAVKCHIEGSQLLDNEPVFSYVNNNAPKTYLINSIFNGNVIVPDNGQSYTYPSAVYVNSSFKSNPTLSKLLVKVEDKIPTVLLDATPKPYPQLLVTQ